MVPFHEGYRPAPEVPQSPTEYVLGDFPRGSGRGVKLNPVPSGGVSLFPLYVTTSSTTHPAFSSSRRTGGPVRVSLSYVLMAIRTGSKLKLRSDKKEHDDDGGERGGEGRVASHLDAVKSSRGFRVCSQALPTAGPQ